VAINRDAGQMLWQPTGTGAQRLPLLTNAVNIFPLSTLCEDKDVIKSFKESETQKVAAGQLSGNLPRQIQRRA